MKLSVVLVALSAVLVSFVSCKNCSASSSSSSSSSNSDSSSDSDSGSESESPRILFHGTQNWEAVIAHDPKPFIFVSAIESSFAPIEDYRESVTLGLHLLPGEVEIFEALKPEDLPTFLAKVKNDFEARTEMPLTACLYDGWKSTEFTRRLESALSELGIRVFNKYKRDRRRGGDKYTIVDVADEEEMVEAFFAEAAPASEAAELAVELDAARAVVGVNNEAGDDSNDDEDALLM